MTSLEDHRSYNQRVEWSIRVEHLIQESLTYIETVSSGMVEEIRVLRESQPLASKLTNSITPETDPSRVRTQEIRGVVNKKRALFCRPLGHQRSSQQRRKRKKDKNIIV